MGDLRSHSSSLSQLRAFIAQFEGRVDHFYLDSEGLVTIGIGHLMDSRNGFTEQQVRQAITRVTDRLGPIFRRRSTGAVAALQEIVADWQSVKAGQAATLYIPQSSIDRLLEMKLNIYIDALYHERPFVIDLDDRIQIVLVDARYAPHGVSLFSSAMAGFWAALNPASPTYNLELALQIFDRAYARAYAHAVRERTQFARRHPARLQLFRAAIATAQGARGPQARPRLSGTPPSFAESYLDLPTRSDVVRSQRTVEPGTRGILDRGLADRGL